ncbi:hypothetical protein [Lapillicoccus jejuensis]|uniref:Uncharacterized protein n=1 Tax=Lapillicoccus jejuensis TaxID=402171 RepID=A0A542DVM9_9MICO|nr:hypothetical protein [Lapillicoccus jejuensis]TQJ07138.1 hypothetical protein FB458_0188 [Lapillicoccus jejuensis]
MAEVDPEDDSIERFVVYHYRYDPQRSERRNVVVAAYDDAGEFEARVDHENARLRGRAARGERIDPREHISGTVLPPGYARLAARARLVRRANVRGVAPGRRLDRLELPDSVAVLRPVTEQDDPDAASRER